MYRQHFPEDPGQHHEAYYNNHRRRDWYGNRRQPTLWQRIKYSLFAIVFGFIIIVIASVLVFWNEGRAVQTAKSLEEGLRILVPLQNTAISFKEHNGKLVHLTGKLKTTEPLVEPDYDLSIFAVKMKRRVQMFQWVETGKTREFTQNGHVVTDRSYDYDQEWKDHLISSSSFNTPFGHENPKTFPLESKTHIAKTVKIGAFSLSDALKEKVSNYVQFHPTKMPKNGRSMIHLGNYFHGKNPNKPEVGDWRVTFEYAGLSGPETAELGPPDDVSIVAKQENEELQAFKTEAGDNLELLYTGHYTPHQIIGKEHAHNMMLMWAIRLVGWLLMFIGFGCTNKLFIALADSIPVVGELVAMGLTVANMTCSISLSLMVIALGWIRYRPWLGFSILVCSIVPFILNRQRVAGRRSSSHRNT